MGEQRMKCMLCFKDRIYEKWGFGMSQNHRNKISRISKRFALTVLPVVLWASTSLAADDSALSEIVVTATKRSENVQNVPIAISAFSGTSLAEVGAKTTFDIASQTEGLRIESASGLALPRFNLRGVGGDEYSPNANQSVGVYMDEVFINNTVGQGFPLFDLDQVEVLRGPQGTLWGKNTSAGALSFTSRKPSEDMNGYATETFGSFGEKDTEAAIGGTLIDGTLLGRASILYNTRDGFVRDSYLGTDVGGYTQAAGRVQLLWKITDDGELLVNAHQSHSDYTIPLYHSGYLPGGVDFNGVSTSTDPFRTSQATTSPGVVNTSGGNAKLDWNLAADWHLTNILAAEDNNFSQILSDDATPLNVIDEYTKSSADQVSEEFRIASPAHDRVTWIFGAYGLYETLTSTYAIPQAGNTPGTGSNVDSRFITRNYAAFANSTIHITDKWTASFGLRETREEKSLEQVGVSYTPSQLDPNNVRLSLTPPITYLNYSPRNTWPEITWDAALNYQFNDDVMAYVRSARGFKGGNYNGAISGPGQEGAVSPETILDYEGGVKTTWLERRLTANVDIYHYDYSNLQVSILQNDAAKLENAGKASITGVELEMEARPMAELFVRLSGAYTDAKYDSFPNASIPYGFNAGNPVNLSGQPLERAPRQTVSILTRYGIPVTSGKITLQTDWHYTSYVPFQSWVNAPNLHPTPTFLPLMPTIFAQTAQRAETTGNARIEYTDQSDRFNIAAWAKNVTNKRYKTNVYNLPFNGQSGYYLNDPLTFGVTITYHFGK